MSPAIYLRWFDTNGFAIEKVERTPRNAIDALVHGTVEARMVRSSHGDAA